jgi:hypothetical protein
MVYRIRMTYCLKLFKIKIETLFRSQSVIILILNTRPTLVGFGMIKNGMKVLGGRVRGIMHVSLKEITNV